ncbi:MAG: hypothetical protein ABI859_16545 [Pseudomonadota bacterium]
MNSQEPFELTVGDVAQADEARHEVRIDPGSVRHYAELGLLDFRRLSNGTRLFRLSARAEARRIREQRLANRGRKAA